jgi:hypothetical protein
MISNCIDDDENKIDNIATDDSTIEFIKKNSHQAINLKLAEIEEKYKIKILYACETGSRASGVDVEESDFDIKGFYIARECEYLKVIRSVKQVIKEDHLNLFIDKYEFDLDIELRDIKFYLHEKLEKNVLRSDFWFMSKLIYRNLLPEEVTNELSKHLNPDVFIFSPNDKSGLDTLEKNLKHSGKVINKKLLSLLISCINYLHTEVFNEDFNLRFPFYNIYEEIDFIKKNLDKFRKFIGDDFLMDLLIKNLELVHGLHVRKKLGRVSTTKSIPEILSKFYRGLSEKFRPEEKRKNLPKIKCELNLEWAQIFFEECLYKYNKNE